MEPSCGNVYKKWSIRTQKKKNSLYLGLLSTTEEWRKLHNEELTDLYYSPNIIQVIGSRRKRLAVHVARMRKGEVHTGFWWKT
jgi:hypothetical protein